jgi:serine/threonine-protein kinase HipA
MNMHAHIPESLSVYLTHYGPLITQEDRYLKVGTLHHQQGHLHFQYTPSYCQNHQAKPLSQALPLSEEVFTDEVVAPYFSGLLPDELVRKRLARYLGVSEQNTFALLAAIGGECAGAISLLPDTEEASSLFTPKGHPIYQALTDVEASKLFATLEKRPLLVGEEGVRMSGAGAQDKLMVLILNDGTLTIPKDYTPSSHIIKPAIRDLPDTVHNEYFCMRLAQEVGLPTPEVNIRWIENIPYYLVARYDRHHEKQNTTTLENTSQCLIRVHQEDFCQALHRPPHQKYENEGGPSLVDCFTLLHTLILQGEMLGREKLHLFEKVLFNFLIGNGDAHGKNFSLVYEESIKLAPTYDVLCTVIYGNTFKAKMAMKLGGEYTFKRIAQRHLLHLAEQVGFKPSYILKRSQSFIQNVTTKAKILASTLQAHEETASPIYEDIVTVIETHTRQLTTS